MHSYKSLAVLALVVSTASTAYSAPVHESQQQARSAIGGPFNVGTDGLSLPNITAILDRLHPFQSVKPGSVDARETGSFNVGTDGLSLPNITAILDRLHPFQSVEPGSVAARETVDLDQRAPASAFGDILGDLFHSGIAKNILTNVAGGIAGAGAGLLTTDILNQTRRDVPLDLSDCTRSSPNEAGVCQKQPYIERDDVLTRDVIDVLQLLRRQLIELD